jgi:hypothetical protein
VKNFSSPWADGWKQRIQERVQSFGFASLDDYLREYPGDTYFELADRLGGGGKDVAPIQIQIMQFEGSVPRGQGRDAAKDSLVRLLRQNLKRGWSAGVHAKFRRASTYAQWLGLVDGLNDPSLRGYVDAVWSKLESLNPDKNWKPLNVEDFLISKAFSEWPDGAQCV